MPLPGAEALRFHCGLGVPEAIPFAAIGGRPVHDRKRLWSGRVDIAGVSCAEFCAARCFDTPMGIASPDVVPLPQDRASLSELVDRNTARAKKIITKNGESYVAVVEHERLDYDHRLERECVHLLLEDARRGLVDVKAGRTEPADSALEALQARRAGPAAG